MTESRVKVLVVDDNLEVLETFCEMLESRGYDAISAETGMSALLRIGSARPDAVVLDIHLTDCSGLELYRAVRSDEEFTRLPILFVSGVFLNEELLRGTVGDPDALLLLKPVTGEQLIGGIEKVLAFARQQGRVA